MHQAGLHHVQGSGGGCACDPSAGSTHLLRLHRAAQEVAEHVGQHAAPLAPVCHLPRVSARMQVASGGDHGIAGKLG